MKRPYLSLWLLLLLMSSPWRADAGGEIPAEVFFRHPVYHLRVCQACHLAFLHRVCRACYPVFRHRVCYRCCG